MAGLSKTVLLRQERVRTILPVLKHTYPKSACSLTHAGAYQLLVATILSAQCTDQRVNLVTPALFAKYPTVEKLAQAKPPELERAIQSTGFFRAKARSLLGMAQSLVEKHGGQVPKTMDELTHLPGVGRKTANVVLGNAFGINDGIVVDTHVSRLSQRLGLTRHGDPKKIETDLVQILPKEDWTLFSHLLIDHGRAICQARKPKCDQCPIFNWCPTGKKLIPQ